jgi:hypothetical protein
MPALKRQIANWLRAKANDLDPPRSVSFEYVGTRVKIAGPSETWWSIPGYRMTHGR